VFLVRTAILEAVGGSGVTAKTVSGVVALASAFVLLGCGPAPKTETCVPSCPDSARCSDGCGSMTCPCPSGDVCDSSGACVPCVVGSCQHSGACVDQCGNADTSCATNCADPVSCVDNCGISDSPACAGAACDPYYPGGCLDTCGHYAAGCCCVPRGCANATTCVDDCGNFDPAACQGLACGSACEDTCGVADRNCWVLCADPTDCQDDCGNYNSTACSGQICDPITAGFDSCGQINDGC
jgi:hypothetical protein